MVSPTRQYISRRYTISLAPSLTMLCGTIICERIVVVVFPVLITVGFAGHAAAAAATDQNAGEQVDLIRLRGSPGVDSAEPLH